MSPQAAPTPVAASATPTITPLATAGIGNPAAAPPPGRAPIPTPSLKPGEVITWIRIERPRLELGQILVGSFVLVGLILGFAVLAGVLLGHLRSKNTTVHGAGGLDLR